MQSRGRQVAGRRIRRTGDTNAPVLLSIPYPHARARPEPYFSFQFRRRRNPAVCRLGGKSASCVYEEGAESARSRVEGANDSQTGSIDANRVICQSLMRRGMKGRRRRRRCRYKSKCGVCVYAMRACVCRANGGRGRRPERVISSYPSPQPPTKAIDPSIPPSIYCDRIIC